MLPELACLEPGRGDQVSEAGPVVLMGNARPPAQPRSDVARWLQRVIPKGKSLVTSVPYLWLLFFFLIPFVIVLKISFSDTQIAMPPYQPLFSWAADQVLQVKLHLSNFAFLVEDDLYWMSYLTSLKVAAISTLLCLLMIGYPMAYAIARSGSPRATYCCCWLSCRSGLRSCCGVRVDRPAQEQRLHQQHAYGTGSHRPANPDDADGLRGLPRDRLLVPAFMILPLYTNLVKVGPDAARGRRRSRQPAVGVLPQDHAPAVGARHHRRLHAGVYPAIGEFVIPSLLGDGMLMIGKVLWTEFSTTATGR